MNTQPGSIDREQIIPIIQQLLNQRFTPLKDRKLLDTIDKISIEKGFLPDKEMVFTFASPISYAGTSVGTAHVAVSADHRE